MLYLADRQPIMVTTATGKEKGRGSGCMQRRTWAAAVYRDAAVPVVGPVVRSLSFIFFLSDNLPVSGGAGMMWYFSKERVRLS